MKETLEKIGIRDDSFELLTVRELVANNILDKPMDGNHGELHPKGHDFVTEGVPFIMATDVKDSRVDYTSCKFITAKQADSLRKGFARNGDVLLTHKATIGRTAIVNYDKHPYIMLTPQVTFYRVRDSQRLNNRYLRCYFESQLFQKTLQLWADSGSTRAYLGITEQQKLPIIVPPIRKQLKIAAILSAYDELIEKNSLRIALLERLADEIYREWFVRLRFHGQTKARLEILHLRDFIQQYVGGDWGEDVQSLKFRNPVHVIRGTDFESIQRGDISSVPLRYITDSALRSRKLKPGDLILENSVNHQSRTAGKSLLVTQHVLDLFEGDVICASFCKLVRPKNMRHSNFLSLNLRLLFKQGLFDYFQNVATNGIANLQAERLMDRHLVPFDEDIDLTIFDSLDTSLLAKSLAKLKQTRDMLLPRLISGKLSVETLDIRFPPSMAEESEVEPLALVHA